MIVKNEILVLKRLFDSLKDIIDYYIIVDTGSTDGTPEFVRQKMEEYGIAGEVYCHDWVNFGFNRNQALQYVYKKKYQGWVLFIDADEEFAYSDPRFYEKLQPGVTYQLEKHHNELRYSLPNLVDVAQTRWEWHGVVHEYLLHISGSTVRKALDVAWIVFHEGEGARSRGLSDEEKFLADAALLEGECKKNPQDARSRFYLAQSYHNAEKIELGYQNYLERTELNGWDEENFLAWLRAGRLAILLNKAEDVVVRLFEKAHSMRPLRAEPLHDLAAYYRKRKQYQQAYFYAKKAVQLPLSKDRLFVDRDIYDWKSLDELAVSAYWVGKYKESRDACKTICKRLQEKDIYLDKQTMQRIEENLDFAIQQLSKIQENISDPNYSELLIGAGSRINKDLIVAGIPQDFMNVTLLDNNKDHKPDVVWDLQKHPLPFADNSFNEIHAYEVLEHLADQGDYHFFFAEFSEYHRILRPGGLFLASVPARDSVWAWGDPSHKRIIQPETLLFLDQGEYDRQVGVTKMSDFRYLYKAHFKTIYSQIEGNTFYFALQSVTR